MKISLRGIADHIPCGASQETPEIRFENLVSDDGTTMPCVRAPDTRFFACWGSEASALSRPIFADNAASPIVNNRL